MDKLDKDKEVFVIPPKQDVYRENKCPKGALAPVNENRKKSTFPGRPRGSRDKKTIRIMELCEKYNFDPVEASIQIAAGKALHEKHPFLKTLRYYLDFIEADLRSVKQRPDGIDRCKELWNQGRAELTGCYTPIEIRSKHITDLLQYIHPKKKAIDLSIGMEEIVDNTPITEEEFRAFKIVFDGEY